VDPKILKGGSPDSDLNFFDQVVRMGIGCVEQEFVLSLFIAALPHEAGLPNE
jgi:hypothetical protein